MEIIDKGEATEQRVDWAPATTEISREQVLSEIQKAENPATDVPQTPAPAAVEPAGQTIAPVQPSGQVAGTDVSPAPAAAPTQGQPPEAVTPPALTEAQVKEFLDKKHIPPQDTWKVAKMYQDAQKALTQKSMELANLKRVVPAVQPSLQPVQTGISPITGLPYESADLNAQMLEDINHAPAASFKKIAEITYGPKIDSLLDSLNEQKLHNTVVRLSTSPETAEFNLPAVQEKIKEIMTERPDLSGNLSENLPILNDLAIGRLYREGKLNKDAVEAGKKLAEQNLATRQAATMETGSKATTPAVKEFKDMNLDEQGAYLKQLIANS